MAIIRSFGAMQRIAAPTPTWASPAQGAGVAHYGASYAAIYRTQPNVRTVVDFLARNVAQLGLHVFRRVSDTDRARLAGHPVANLLQNPNPYTTRYRLFESLMQDLGIYGNAFWLKVRNGDRIIGLARLPPECVTVEGGIFVSAYVWTANNGERTPLDRSEIVHFRRHDPENPLVGLSPIETLRQLLAEERAAAIYRQSFWRNAARPGMIITRPKEAGTWKAEQVKEWKRQMGEFESGPNAGRTLLLQEGMTPVITSQSAKDSELTASRKLTREECAAAYHVPLPMVGILDHATFSNIKEQHKHLYADCLGPDLVMIEEELENNVVPEMDDAEGIYLEFNIQEKLKGSFEEQTNSLRIATGGKPILTQNEARARINAPKSNDPGTDSLEPTANIAGNRMPEDEPDAQVDTDAAMAAVRASWERQEARLAKIPEEERAEFFGRTLVRWDLELAEDLTAIYGDASPRIASVINGETLALLNAGKPAFDREVVLPC